MLEDLRKRLDALPGRRYGERTVRFADDFAYTDPVDGA